MKHTAPAAALKLVLCWACVVAAPAIAQDHLRPNPFIDVSDDSYKQPDRQYLTIYDQLRQRRVLEELRDFLKPLRLPRQLKVVVAQCGGAETLPYESGKPVTICYELIDRVKQLAKQMHPNDAAAQDQVVVAGFIQATLHETAHAIFQILDIPIWGRAEDAADRLAALVMVEFGEDVALAVLKNTVLLFEHSAKLGNVWTGSDFASTKSPDARRFFNYACIAAGADFVNFGGWVQREVIPSLRSPFCAEWSVADGTLSTTGAKEYEAIRKAFNLRIMPYVDPDALVEARSTPWLSWTPKK